VEAAWITILFSLIASAYFSGTEIAFVSTNKLRAELKSKQGVMGARILSHFLKNPSEFIGTLLIGNNIALVIYGLTVARVLEPMIVNTFNMDLENQTLVVLLIQTIIATLVVLITAEFLPKVLFRINPNKILNTFAVPNLIIHYLLYPITQVIVFISGKLLKGLFNIELNNDKTVFGTIDLDRYIEESNTYKSKNNEEIDSEIVIFKNALDFNEVKARHCMIPRTEIIAVDIQTETIEELRDKFVETGLSKILVYKETIDNIVGFVTIKDFFKKPKDIKSILMPVGVIPESFPGTELLREFTEKRKSIAIVVDEHGGTAGIVTMEDVIEEIFGEIQDEHDKETYIEKQLGIGEYLLSGRLEIDYLNDKYDLNIPEGEYETLAGFIFTNFESLPELNEEIHLPPFLLHVVSLDNQRIDKVKLKVLDKYKD
jgi:putative hemolysin